MYREVLFYDEGRSILLIIKTIYSSKHTQSINKIILIKNGEILKVFKR